MSIYISTIYAIPHTQNSSYIVNLQLHWTLTSQILSNTYVSYSRKSQNYGMQAKTHIIGPLALDIVTRELCCHTWTWSTWTTAVFDSVSLPHLHHDVPTQHQSKMRSLRTSGATRVQA